MTNSGLDEYPRVVIIILNFNGWDDTSACLESIYNLTYPNWEILLVDNGSTDDFTITLRSSKNPEVLIDSRILSSQNSKTIIDNQQLLHYYEQSKKVTASSLEKKQKISFLPKRLSVLLLKHNYGFTGGNNIAINHVLNEKKAEFVLLLNNDTIVDKQSLTELIKVAWSNKKIGFVGPQIYEIADTKSAEVISSAGGKFNINTGRSGHIGNKEIENGQYDHIRAVDFIEGTSILARTQMIKDVGLLNPFYFTYWEDVEWCLRGREQGYTSVHAPAAKIWHKIGYLKKNRTSNAYYYYGRNLILLIKQHANSKQKAAFAFCFLGAEIWFNLLITLKTSRSIKVSLRYLRGILDGFLSNSEFFIDCNVESKRLDNSSKKDK